MAKWRLERTERFRILHRDRFMCRYCLAMPGSDLMEVDHLIPRSLGGSDNPLNLVASCKTCNSRKSNTIFFPHDLIESADDDDGWFVHKTYGVWAIKFCDDTIGVDKEKYGFIEGRRLFDRHLIRHLYDKPWPKDVFRDMEAAFDHLTAMMTQP